MKASISEIEGFEEKIKLVKECLKENYEDGDFQSFFHILFPNKHENLSSQYEFLLFSGEFNLSSDDSFWIVFKLDSIWRKLDLELNRCYNMARRGDLESYLKFPPLEADVQSLYNLSEKTSAYDFVFSGNKNKMDELLEKITLFEKNLSERKEQGLPAFNSRMKKSTICNKMAKKASLPEPSQFLKKHAPFEDYLEAFWLSYKEIHAQRLSFKPDHLSAYYTEFPKVIEKAENHKNLSKMLISFVKEKIVSGEYEELFPGVNTDKVLIRLDAWSNRYTTSSLESLIESFHQKMYGSLKEITTVLEKSNDTESILVSKELYELCINSEYLFDNSTLAMTKKDHLTKDFIVEKKTLIMFLFSITNKFVETIHQWICVVPEKQQNEFLSKNSFFFEQNDFSGDIKLCHQTLKYLLKSIPDDLEIDYPLLLSKTNENLFRDNVIRNQIQQILGLFEFHFLSTPNFDSSDVRFDLFFDLINNKKDAFIFFDDVHERYGIDFSNVPRVKSIVLAIFEQLDDYSFLIDYFKKYSPDTYTELTTYLPEATNYQKTNVLHNFLKDL